MQNRLNRRQSEAYKDGFRCGIYRREDGATDVRPKVLSVRKATEFLRGFKNARELRAF